ncbi:MAG: ribosome small subunit-dependent GTPase A [Gammaproteobacteria bacterium]|nr:ribosome small subunit-dependent GTPase A [Gammaproteobacteria bacterium]
MSKRKLSLQQRTRVQKIQSDWLEPPLSAEDTQTGLVLCSYGKRAEIETPKGHIIRCMIRPNLPRIVAGDQVIWSPSTERTGVIVSHHPRESVLERLDKNGQAKPLAANVTQLIIVVAIMPPMNWTLLDNYLITADYLNLNACLILNKADLPSEPIQSMLTTHYLPLGYPLLYTTKQDPASFTALETQLKDQTSIFVGQSGVGKSSIIAALLPHVDNIQTSPLSLGSGLGKHTTSYARYYHLPHGGALIDSPGVRSFTPPFLDPTRIAYGYREFRPFLGQCQFRNCDHLQTGGGCAIIHAVETQQISAFRYQQFTKLVRGQ